MNNLRNFCIIAHINHGKSTLADRLLDATGSVIPKEMKEQFLDSNPIERERGITIKLAPVRMKYKSPSGEDYILNLIDTPGHIDFSYEVSRSLAACEGALLVVDAVSGIQAQTLANLSLAKKQGLVLIPVVNKIDLEIAQPEKVAQELVDTLGFKEEEIIFASAKTGKGAEEILEAVVKRIPCPKGNVEKPFKALIFSSHYDSYKGVVIWLRVIDGEVTKKDIKDKEKIKFLGTQVTSSVLEVGYWQPRMMETESLASGEIGFLATGLKDISLSRVGDTISFLRDVGVTPLSGYEEAKSMVFAGLYPVDSKDFLVLNTALSKLKLSDAALSFSPEVSQGLGKGFRCGFLGLLHVEIIQERLEREFGVSLVITLPTVEYRIEKTNGQQESVLKAADFPDAAQISKVFEPQVKCSIFSPVEFSARVISLCKERRAVLVGQEYIGSQIKMEFKMPLSEMVTDFYDQVKSVSSGFASLDWEKSGFTEVEAVRMDVLINGQKVDAFSQIIPKSMLQDRGRRIAEKLKKLIHRQLFEVIIQAAVGGKIIARERIAPFRKDVTAKLYGGDRTRRMKLLEKQKKGKKRMKQIGRVAIPQEAFLGVLKG